MKGSGIVNGQPEEGRKSIGGSSKALFPYTDQTVNEFMLTVDPQNGVVANSKYSLSLSPLSPQDVPLPSPSSENHLRPL